MDPLVTTAPPKGPILDGDAHARISERADLIGKIVWQMVLNEAKNNTGRSIQLLAGLRPEHLAGISRTLPSNSSKKIDLKIRKDIDAALTASLSADHLTDKPAVYFRNSDAADIILFAVSDEERETVGASLNPVSRIDRNSIQEQIDLWVAVIVDRHVGDVGSNDRRNWIKALLKGLNQSGVTRELDQFAEFVLLLQEKTSLPWPQKVHQSAPALHMPTYSFARIPALETARSKLEQEFRGMFRGAEQEVANYVYLLDKTDKRVDTDQLLERLDENEVEYSTDKKIQADAIRALVADRKHLRHGSWRLSQEIFCKTIDWTAFGKNAFGVRRRRRTPDLSERTRELLTEEFADKFEGDEAAQQYLEDLGTKDTTPEQDQDFFDTWQDELRSGTSVKVYEAWRRHLFSDEVTSDDLQVSILEGIHALLMKTANDDGKIATGGKIEIKAKHCEKLSSWSSLDARVYALFRQEAQLLQKVLSGHVEFNFGRWLDQKAIDEATGQSKKDARQIEFEMGLVADDGSDCPLSHRVRIFWTPSVSSIAMAWPEDINALYEGMTDGFIRVHDSKLSMKPGVEINALPVSLYDTGTFVDVAHGEEGRTADPASAPKEEDLFVVIGDELTDHEAGRHIDAPSKDAILQALAEFRQAFTNAIIGLKTDPENLYQTDLIEKQAQAFGQLCKVARQKLNANTNPRLTTMGKITEFGIVISATSEEGAVIPAWHPLRLLERQAKARDLADFVETLLSVDTVSDDGLKRACDERRYLYKKWFFPEVISVNHKSYAALQDCAGYSFAVPVGTAASDPQELEATASTASRQFLSVSDRYLELNPHEEGNFSTAIFNADTVSLPGMIAKGLEDRMARNGHLRCSLLISHDNPDRMRKIYATQNARLRAQNLDEVTEGFLSRLRVGVGKGDSARKSDRRNSTDLVFLHDVFFKQSEMTWDYERGEPDTLPDAIDFRNVALPRRRAGDAGNSWVSAKTIEMSLTVTHPPRAAAEFLDLCHCCREDLVIIPEGWRALPLRRVSWDTTAVRRTIERAHAIGEWVVSVDSMSSRQMLADNGIKVIRDVQLPDSELRVLVSSREPSANLVRHIQSDFEHMVDAALHDDAQSMARRTISTVVEVCGQKILSSARSKSAAREVIGLAAATSLIRIDKRSSNIEPIWFSLDDNRAFFGLTGKMADTLALSVSKNDAGDFVIHMSVVEAKCVAATSSTTESKSSREQVSSTLNTLRANFVDQQDPVAKQAWGVQLLHLMVLRPEYVRFFGDIEELDRFRSSLARGEVQYRVEGRSIVVIHDDETADDSIIVTLSTSDDDVWQYQVRQRALGRLMRVIEDPQSPDAPSIPVPEGFTKRECMEPKRRSEPSFPETVNEQSVKQTAPTNPQQVLSDDELVEQNELAQGLAEEPDAEIAPVSNRRIRPALENALQLSMTRNGGQGSKEQELEFAVKTARQLQAALTELGMHAVLMPNPTISTPNGVLVNFAGHGTLTVKKLEPKLLELKTTFGLDVTDIRTGLGRISLFVAAQKRQIVDLARVWLEAIWPVSCPNSTSRFLIGLREDSGEPLWLNLQGSHGENEEHAPHTLIAGETGSGKGVLTQNLLLQMIAFNHPKNFKLYVIDPKFGVDFFWISQAPHLAREIVTTQEAAEQVLNEIVEEMNRRYELFMQARVPKISEYNARVSETERLPLITVVHDEMADWMAGSEDYRHVVQSCFTRLAAKARACGIHIIMITQRAAQDAIPVGIRDNLGNRLCLKVASTAGSKLALGVEGAERLLGKGHVAARLGGDKPSGEEYFIAQVPFASTEDLEIFASAALDGL
ncbi:FtsK/SpoIIIE domain-containing protein [Pelagibius sp. Alg239-R121]|uniref:FtsK/SpoIIIE domain-containing protein n=1 Tax=Pelagibius sp. Alg239-R121 TaxID=2993448 RepID=UPI0024A70A95|nr:FtsK/SpoIIIE domain-containing protein [Pelagibius sp. Alg239-R121]